MKPVAVNAAVLAGCLALSWIFYLSISPWMLDDAFIHFRYAENLAVGNGLVYNPGERVEGCTSILWAALLGAAAWMGFDLPSAAQWLGLFFYAACLAVMLSAPCWLSVDQKTARLGAVLAASSGAMMPWPYSGMEVTLFAFLLTASLAVYLRASRVRPSSRGRALAGGLCALTAAARPEGLMLFAWLAADSVFAPFIERRRGATNRAGEGTFKGWRGAVWFLAGFAALYVPFFAWRYSYYGALLPNTFHAKVGFTFAQVERGWNYAMAFAKPALGLLAGALLWLWVARRARWFENGAYLIAAIVVTCSAFIIVVGGDAMPAFRFFAPIVPWLGLMAAMGMVGAFKTPRAVLAAVSAVFLFNLYQAFADWNIHGHLSSDDVVRFGRPAGEWLREHSAPDAVIATNTAGSIPFYSKRAAIDMLGLNDAHIARREMDSMGRGSAGHEKGDGAYVLSRKPDIIILGSSSGAIGPMMPGDRELTEHPEFREMYERQIHSVFAGRDFIIYVRKDTLRFHPPAVRRDRPLPFGVDHRM